MDYETIKLMNEARVAVASANENALVYMFFAVLLIGATGLYIKYLFDRWSWIPRRKPIRVFVEKI